MKDLKQSLFESFNLESLPAEKQEEIVLQIGKVVFQSILIRVIPLLSEAEKEEFANIVEENMGEENTAILDYLTSKIENLDEIVAEEIETFRSKSVDILSKIK